MELSAELAYNVLINKEKSIMLDIRSVFSVYFNGFAEIVENKVFWMPLKLRKSGVVNPNFIDSFRAKFDKYFDSKIFVICRRGSSSKDVASLLVDYGFDAVSVIDGFSGYYGWVSSKLPITNEYKFNI
jgi:rhodanese-related sulfurtransferase